MGKLLDLKLLVDHRLLGLVNLARAIKKIKLSSSQRSALRATRRKFKSFSRRGEKILICGNGPSINELDFTLFESCDSVVANFFYKHPKAKELNPKFYVIIDGKIVDGIWPVTMIDEIFERFPDTELFLDVRWLNSALLKPYVGRKGINWILPSLLPTAYSKPRRDLAAPLCGLNVVASAIGIATSVGYTKIGIAGVDGDGLFREILDRPSHFYEGAKDISMSSFESMVKSLVLSTENLWAWQGIVQTHSAEGINLVNVCRGGIMDCMKRVSPTSFLNL